jgi:hypothetical protein
MPMLDFYGREPERGDQVLVIRDNNSFVQVRVINVFIDQVVVDRLKAKESERDRDYAYLRKSGRFVIIQSWDGRPIGP